MTTRKELVAALQFRYQLVAGFDQTRRSAVGRALGMGRNGCGEARDAMMCVVAGRFRYGADERDHGAMRRRWNKGLEREISCGSSGAG